MLYNFCGGEAKRVWKILGSQWFQSMLKGGKLITPLLSLFFFLLNKRRQWKWKNQRAVEDGAEHVTDLWLLNEWMFEVKQIAQILTILTVFVCFGCQEQV